MSEPFQRVQNHFRFLKHTHNIDLTVPHGVAIDGKNYPAINKRITLGHTITPNFDSESSFYIPLENGSRVHAVAYLGGPSSIHMQMHVPEIYLHANGKRLYGYGPAVHKHEDSYTASFGENPNLYAEDYIQRPNPYYDERMSLHDTRGPISTVHEVLNMWGKEPYQGTYDFFSKEGYQHFKSLRPHVDFEENYHRPHLELPEDELNEHRQNVKFDPSDVPHNIKVYRVGPDNSEYNYDIKTEQLRKNEKK